MGLGRASTTAEILAPSKAIIVCQVAISPGFVVYSRTLDCGTKIQALAQLWGQSRPGRAFLLGPCDSLVAGLLCKRPRAL